MTSDKVFVQYGWVCPKCDRVMSPTQDFCIFCFHQDSVKSNTGSTSAPYIDPLVGNLISFNKKENKDE